MYIKTIFFFLVFLGALIKPIDVYGREVKLILLVSSESSWNQWLNSSFISSLVPKSSIGSMNIRTNHKDREVESYGTINVGRRWSYYEANNMGAVENGLGDFLNQSNFSTAFFSNNPKLKKIIEDPSGQTTYVSQNFNELYSVENKEILNKSDVILIEMDLYNTEENQRFLLNYVKENPVKLYLFCPYDLKRNSSLTPFLFYDSLRPQHGLIGGNTTRRQGIITNIDIAPTILQQLEIYHSSMVSEGIKTYPNKNAFLIMMKQLSKINYINSLRAPIIKGYILLLSTLLIVFSIISKLNYVIIRKIYYSLVLATLWIPIIFMMNFSNTSNRLYFFGSIFLCIILIGFHVSSRRKALWITSGTTLLLLTLDILFGASLQKNSFLGYDPAIGARFYGIGNEYAGIIIGNLYLFLYAIHEIRHFKIIALLSQFVLILLLCMPFWGANVGATISALSGMSLFLIQFYNYKKNKRIYYFLFFGVLLFGILWITIDSFFVKEQSHLGQTLFQFIDGNFYILIEVIQRKVIMNLQLIRYSMWSKFLFISLVILSMYFDITNEVLKKVGVLFFGAMTGAILFNDSGIVMSGTCIIYLVFPYLYVYNHNIGIEKEL